jgi:hypothetical protein
MFTLDTLSAMVQKEGLAIVERGLHDEIVRDTGKRERVRIHIAARRTTDPPAIDWPDANAERAALAQVPPRKPRRRIWETPSRPPPNRAPRPSTEPRRARAAQSHSLVRLSPTQPGAAGDERWLAGRAA